MQSIQSNENCLRLALAIQILVRVTVMQSINLLHCCERDEKHDVVKPCTYTHTTGTVVRLFREKKNIALPTEDRVKERVRWGG